MSSLPISVCIIAKNEKKYIEECLQRLKPFGFEIIVTDTGSTDETREIAIKYADQVIDYTWNQDFSAARNFCARQATNSWILALDCDEYIDQVDVNKLRNAIRSSTKSIGIMRMKNLAYNAKGDLTYSVDDIPRLYHKSYFHFENAVHEQIMPIHPEKIAGKSGQFLLPMEVTHWGYAMPKEEMQKKQKRNLDILFAQLEKNPNDRYLQFQIGQSLMMSERYGEAVTFYQDCLREPVNPNIGFIQEAVYSLTLAYANLDQNTEGLQHMNRFLGKMNTSKFYYSYAGILLANHEFEKGLEAYLKILSMPDQNMLGGALQYCYENIVKLYRVLGRENEAQAFASKYHISIHE